MRRNTILVTVIGIAVLVTALVSGGSANTRHRATKKVLKFSVVEQELAQGRTHPSVQPADIVATTFTLIRGTTTVGRAQNACIAMPDAAAAAAGVAQCTQTFFLDDQRGSGQIVVVRARYPQPHRDAAVIVGGTGVYRGAHGNATFNATASPFAYQVTFALKR
jgi:hypothetical protein